MIVKEIVNLLAHGQKLIVLSENDDDLNFNYNNIEFNGSFRLDDIFLNMRIKNLYSSHDTLVVIVE